MSLSEYHLHNKICQYWNLYFIVMSIFLINLCNAYRLGPGGLAPYPFLQRDRIALFLVKILILLILFSFWVSFFFFTQVSMIAATFILFAKWHFPMLNLQKFLLGAIPQTLIFFWLLFLVNAVSL